MNRTEEKRDALNFCCCCDKQYSEQILLISDRYENKLNKILVRKKLYKNKFLIINQRIVYRLGDGGKRNGVWNYVYDL